MTSNSFLQDYSAMEKTDPVSECTNLANKLNEVDIKLISQNFNAIKKLSISDQYKQLSLLCRDNGCIHPDWLLIAGQIEMKFLKEKIPSKFSECTKKLQCTLDENYYNFVMKNSEELNSMIIEERDFTFNIFAVETLTKSYLSRLISDEVTTIYESPQYMYLRVAVYLWYDSSDVKESLKKIKKMYDHLSFGKYSMASPTMFNSGKKNPQLASCFTLTIGDNMDSITKIWRYVAFISKHCGGVGFDVTSLRHSQVNNHGNTQGIVPWIKILEQIFLTVDQGSKRKGSGTAYLCDWHIDIKEFIDLRKASGPEEMRARNLFYDVWISDEFMRRVRADEDWTLFCPNKVQGLDTKWGIDFEIAYRNFEKKTKNGKIKHFRTVKARELFYDICLSQIETGMPFIHYKDSVNRKTNQQNLGTIRLSNLCVHGDTHILTDQGQIPIQELENKNVNVWNGEEWNNVTVFKTGENKNLLKVVLSNGVEINCTPEHDFYVQSSYKSKHTKIKAKNLIEGSKLINYSLPNAFEIDEDVYFPSPYTHGFFCGNGDYSLHRNRIPVTFLSTEKEYILNYLDHTSYNSYGKLNGIEVMLNKNIKLKFEVPYRSSIKDRLEWLSGYADSVGIIDKNGYNESLRMTCIHKNFLLEIKLLLQTLGVDSKVVKSKEKRISLLLEQENGQVMNNSKELFKLIVSSNDLWILQNIGFKPKTLKISSEKPQRSASQPIKVVRVEDGYQNVDTFCFTEKKRGMGMFNGVLTGQCAEITLYTDKDNVGSCNLGSIALNSCVKFNEGKPYYDFEALEEYTRSLVRNVNQMIDRTYYPSEIPEIKTTNLRNRPLGIGVQGLADVFAMMDLSWLDQESRDLNEMIFETMYYSAVSESVQMAKEKGHYESFPGSPASKGFFQFDLWDKEKIEKAFQQKLNSEKTQEDDFDIENFLVENEKTEGPFTKRYDWDSLRKNMKKYGLRNSLLIALMPTASSANILQNNECFEPFTHLIYTRTVLSGQYVLINKHLVKDLQKIDMWKTEIVRNIWSNRGSLSHVSEENLTEEQVIRLRRLKQKYLTVFEIPQKELLNMALRRGRYVCQTQSFNCWMEDPTVAKLTAYHFWGWSEGAKTGMYYLRQPSRVNPINFSQDSINIPTKRQKKKVVCTDEVCIACSS